MTVILYALESERFSKKKFDHYLNMLPAPMREEIGCYRRWQDAQSSLLGKMLLRDGLCRFFNMGEGVLETIRKDAFGKPYISGCPVDFNISHAEGLVGCCLSDQLRVGIDVERIRPVTLDDFVAEFTVAEMNLIENAADPLNAFFTGWTRKEAVIKADGRGLKLPLNTIRFNEEGTEASLGSEKWYLRTVEVDERYCCSLATSIAVEEPLVLPWSSFEV